MRGEKPEDLGYKGSAEALTWIALRSSLREVLEQVTLADVAHDTLPDHVRERTRGPGAWRRR